MIKMVLQQRRRDLIEDMNVRRCEFAQFECAPHGARALKTDKEHEQLCGEQETIERRGTQLATGERERVALRRRRGAARCAAKALQNEQRDTGARDERAHKRNDARVIMRNEIVRRK